jgi:hypothetical protein
MRWEGRKSDHSVGRRSLCWKTKKTKEFEQAIVLLLVDVGDAHAIHPAKFGDNGNLRKEEGERRSKIQR